ncbi:DUF421 domain-containing protein [Micrococcus terreus]|uniref:DUF421 domain-containing protein n=1 Tax=Micrococcus terreus TaxID=574650 RepID=UPI0021A713F2|nr:YetF domain-containing protein [Micrococcus terreus]MCT2087930.1 DUF421 domain-containing protein [Micrococcus terreus]
MWFDSWADLARILLVGPLAYAVLVVVLRLPGKRTLSQLNVFDFVVTVALGSTFATVVVSSDVSLAEGATALALLAGVQYLVALVSAHWPRSRTALTARPVLLLKDGRIRQEELRRHRLTVSELRQAVRMQGVGDLAQVKAVVLETNGKLSVVTDGQYGAGTALEDVLGGPDGA